MSSGVLAVACYLLRTLLIGIFTSDKDVLVISLEVFPVMCATIVTDGVNVSIEGTLQRFLFFAARLDSPSSVKLPLVFVF